MITELKTKDVLLAAALNIGIAKRKAGEWDEAFAYYERTRPLFSEAEPLECAKFHNGYGVLCQEYGEKFEKREYFEKTIHAYKEVRRFLEMVDDELAIGIVINNTANVLLSLGQITEAHKQLDESEIIFIAYGDETFLGQALEIRARCYFAQSDFRRAAIAINKSEAILLNGIEKDPLVETLKTKALIAPALEAQICLEYQNVNIAAERFGITRQGVNKKIEKYFGVGR